MQMSVVSITRNLHVRPALLCAAVDTESVALVPVMTLSLTDLGNTYTPHKGVRDRDTCIFLDFWFPILGYLHNFFEGFQEGVDTGQLLQASKIS